MPAIFQIDHDPIELGRNFPTARYLQSDSARCFEDLLGRVSTNRREPWRAFIKNAVKDWLDKAGKIKSSDSTPMKPRAALP